MFDVQKNVISKQKQNTAQHDSAWTKMRADLLYIELFIDWNIGSNLKIINKLC